MALILGVGLEQRYGRRGPLGSNAAAQANTGVDVDTDVYVDVDADVDADVDVDVDVVLGRINKKRLETVFRIFFRPAPPGRIQQSLCATRIVRAKSCCFF